QQPLISILVPFKNTSPFLSACLQSIRQQTYEHWELIAIDDHSTDDSPDIVKAYALEDNRIKVFQNNGHGIIEALQMAFSKSKGQMITRMDSDDIMHPEKLFVLQHQLQDAGRGHVAIGQVQYFSEAGISDGYARYEKWINKLTATGTNYDEIYKECVIPSPCFMVYSDDLVACGDFQPDRYPEDYDLTFRFYQHGLKCIPCDRVLHYWRDYSSRTSRTHIHYANNTFLAIKLHYFLLLDHDPERPLTLWGAGDKGKFIARGLIERDIPFHWICDNPKKIGHAIYEQEMKDVPFLQSLYHPQSIVTVANELSQKEIIQYMEDNGHTSMRDYFFFC
ncbi:MAG: glycosyltransferase, partial [Cyclobacteriaceae bacterium]|nr:glycosyltransferase [Cyclobacteriaceae bacterium]